MENLTISEAQQTRQTYKKALIQGAKAKIKHTGQIVNVVRVSDHGISVVSFRTGGEFFMSNKFLEPLLTIH